LKLKICNFFVENDIKGYFCAPFGLVSEGNAQKGLQQPIWACFRPFSAALCTFGLFLPNFGHFREISVDL
jgi:hypothetical protein